MMQFRVGPAFPTRRCNSAVCNTEKPHDMILCAVIRLSIDCECYIALIQ